LARTWTKEEHSYLKQLVDNSEKKTWRAFAKEMSQTFKQPYNVEQVRSYWRTNVRGTNTLTTPDYSETVEILPNGSVKSDKLIQLSLEQAKDQQYILEAHGFDHTEWEVVSAKSSQWNHSNKEHGTSLMYSSKVTVKPKKDSNELTKEDIISKLSGEVKSVVIPVNYVGENNLVIGLADLHFGITQLSDTLVKLDDIKSIIQNGYKQIVIEQLGDLFHSSQMKTSQTLKGTILDDVDMVKAIEDAKTFFDVIITEALRYSKKVSVEHASGNHSDFEYMFLIYLEAKYPDVKVNYHNDYRTAYMLDNVGIMLTHGDTAKNKLPQLFATEYKMIWSLSETMEIHKGHYHSVEKEMDGVIIRQFGTPKPNDAYEVRNGWTNNRKVIQLIEYDSFRPKIIYEV